MGSEFIEMKTYIVVLLKKKKITTVLHRWSLVLLSPSVLKPSFSRYFQYVNSSFVAGEAVIM